MATSSVFNLNRFTVLATGDVIPIVDVSDSSQSASGSLDSITCANFFASIPAPVNVTSASATALAVGRLGATTPALQVDASAATSVTGLKVSSAASGAGAFLTVVGGGTDENMWLTTKGEGVFQFRSGAGTAARIVGYTGGASTNPVSIGTNPDSTTYGAVSFGADLSNTGRIGIMGGGGSDKTLYLDTIATGTFAFRVAVSNVFTISATGAAVASASIVATTGFGCNSQAAQTAYASGGALNAYGAGANGLDSGANMSALHAMVVAIRAALVANGIMS